MEEDQIIKETLRKNSKRDIIDYSLIGFVFVMIFVPALFKVIFYDSSVKITTQSVVYLNLVCRKGVFLGDEQITYVIENNYRDSIIQKSTVTFNYSEKNEDNVPEIKQILELDFDEIEKSSLENGYKFVIDFSKNKDLLDVPALSNYSLSAPSATQQYSSDGYYCERSSKVVEEEIE